MTKPTSAEAASSAPSSERSLPVRRLEAFLPGDGLEGAANHWNGQTWRWAEYDATLRTQDDTDRESGEAVDGGDGSCPH